MKNPPPDWREWCASEFRQWQSAPQLRELPYVRTHKLQLSFAHRARHDGSAVIAPIGIVEPAVDVDFEGVEQPVLTIRRIVCLVDSAGLEIDEVVAATADTVLIDVQPNILIIEHRDPVFGERLAAVQRQHQSY